MKDSLQLRKRRRYDAAFCAEALRLVEQSRSTQVVARALNIDPKRIYKWQIADYEHLTTRFLGAIADA